MKIFFRKLCWTCDGNGWAELTKFSTRNVGRTDDAIAHFCPSQFTVMIRVFVHFLKAEKVIYPAGSSTYRKMNKSWNLLYTHTMAIHRNSDAFWWHFIFQIFFCLFLLFLSFFFNAIPLFCRMASRLLLQCQSSIYRQFNDPRRIHTFLFAPTFLHTRIFIINRLVMMNGSNSFSWNHF